MRESMTAWGHRQREAGKLACLCYERGTSQNLRCHPSLKSILFRHSPLSTLHETLQVSISRFFSKRLVRHYYHIKIQTLNILLYFLALFFLNMSIHLHFIFSCTWIASCKHKKVVNFICMLHTMT